MQFGFAVDFTFRSLSGSFSGREKRQLGYIKSERVKYFSNWRSHKTCCLNGRSKSCSFMPVHVLGTFIFN